MARYVVCSSHIITSKIKYQLPDVIYQYIANDSMISWHYTFTRNIENAYFFEEFEMEQAKEISFLWNMKVKRLDV